MSQSSKGTSSNSHSEATSAGQAARAPASDRPPKSSFCAQTTADGSLVQLALQLSSDSAQAQLISDTLAAVSTLLPGCGVEIRTPENRVETPTDPLESSVRSRGRCEWPLADEPEALVLVVALQQVRNTRELAQVLDIGERAATLLGAALRRVTQRQKLDTQTEEIVDLRHRLIQADKLARYGQLVASVLHDLNSPLTAILAYAEFLAKSLVTSAVGQADLDRLAHIHDAAETALRQTKGLVEYSRPPRTLFAAVDLEKCVERALSLCAHELARAGLTLHCRFDRKIPAIDGQIEHLTQLFVNLLTNSAHAACLSDARVDIEAAVTPDRQCVVVTVRDNGQGIQATDLDHVFEPFYTTRGDSGCGLGLSIVRDIAEQHGGSIRVESTPMVGTSFVLTLPLGRHNAPVLPRHTE